MSGTLVYLSTCATDAAGVPGAFLYQELPWLTAHFDRVIVCGHAGVGVVTGKGETPIRLTRPFCGRLRAMLTAPLSRDVWREIAHLKRDGKLNAVNAAKVMLFAMRGRTLANWAKPYLRAGQAATLYAFWMSYDAYAAALLREKQPTAHAVARGHAFDIDIARNPMNPYLMKEKIGRVLDGVYPISRDAMARLLACAPFPEGKVRVLPMGSAGEQILKRFDPPVYGDGVFRVVSCANMLPIKQIPLLIDALAGWRGGRLSWLHIGGGEQEAAVRAYAAQMLGGRDDIHVEITGTVPAQQVQAIFAERPFDVFVNTSRSEGVPVSIMEAMRAGVPIIAPDVGGIAELVDAQIGFLYTPEGGVQAVRDALAAMAALPLAQAQALREAAQLRWQERCQSGVLLAKLFAGALAERVGELPG